CSAGQQAVADGITQAQQAALCIQRYRLDTNFIITCAERAVGAKYADGEPLVRACFFMETVIVAERFFRRLVMHASAIERDLPAAVILAVHTRLDIEMQKGDFTPGINARQRVAQYSKRIIDNRIDTAACGIALFCRPDQQARSQPFALD